MTYFLGNRRRRHENGLRSTRFARPGSSPRTRRAFESSAQRLHAGVVFGERRGRHGARAAIAESYGYSGNLRRIRRGGASGGGQAHECFSGTFVSQG